MKLNEVASVQSGYHSRLRIEPLEDGSHFLFQARDVDVHSLNYRADTLIRFSPVMSRKDWILKMGDILFMARGTRNFSIQLKQIPDAVLAAACFFIVRAMNEVVVPGYLCWYLNQAPVEQYLGRHSGRGVHMPVVRRSVLENIEVPVPSLEIQQKIMQIDELMREEQDLLSRLTEERKKLVTKACFQAVK